MTKEGKGGIYNFVTKRGICAGNNSKISWTQVETGSSITWKYPSVILKGDNSIGEFYSVALTNNMQQADTGTKMMHIGKNTKSRIVSKGISAGKSHNSYRGLVQVSKRADNARNFSQCDSLLMGDRCGAHTFPYFEIKNSSAHVEHEATTSKIGEDIMFYCNQRNFTGRCSCTYRQWLCEGSTESASDGVCCRSAETAGDITGRQCGVAFHHQDTKAQRKQY